jgi:ABC-2 type transport system ATP-binding protein
MLEQTGQTTSSDHLTKIYGKGPKKALDSVTFSIPSHGVFVLIGRNGSGKTTLVRILATELEPTSGSAQINGIDVVRQATELRERIAIVPQEARPIPWMTPMQTVSSYLLWRGFDYNEAKSRAFETLAKLGLERSANSLNRTLSGGMRRKVLVATVLASEAEIIFLDEPTTGLDPISRREFWDLLKEIGRERFTFLTTHYLEEAEVLASSIGVLDRGHLIRIGSLEQLRRSVNYNFSMRIPLVPQPPELRLVRGEMVKGQDGYRILTDEEEAFRISRELSRSGYRFTINPLSLDDVFFSIVSREGERFGNQGTREEEREETSSEQE